VTAEGLKLTEGWADIVEGFEKAGAEPCEYCRDARYLSVESLLVETVRPTRERTIECMSMVTCTCVDPASFAQAVENAADARYRRNYEG
jgi:aerobic-type carbon monoxide dehydrogenase small subunit (CoxS/CutS family)